MSACVQEYKIRTMPTSNASTPVITCKSNGINIYYHNLTFQKKKHRISLPSRQGNNEFHMNHQQLAFTFHAYLTAEPQY